MVSDFVKADGWAEHLIKNVIIDYRCYKLMNIKDNSLIL